MKKSTFQKRVREQADINRAFWAGIGGSRGVKYVMNCATVRKV